MRPARVTGTMSPNPEMKMKNTESMILKEFYVIFSILTLEQIIVLN